MLQKINKQGLLLAIFTYSVWGLFPLYFKLLAGVAADEIVVHRIVWSVLFTLILVLLLRRLGTVKQALMNPRMLLKLLLSAVLLAINWLIFIVATLDNNVLELSLGYYINPIFNALFGLLIFKERLSKYSKIAIALAALGLCVQFFQFSHFPFLAVSVALVFSLYGVVRKGIVIDAVSGLFIETLLLLIPGLIYFFFFTPAASLVLMSGSHYWMLLLILAGPITSIPLITFAAAVRRIPYYLVGFCQYITPTMMFIAAVFLFHESWNVLDLITFAFIWAAVICVMFGVWRGKERQA